jgi:predicted O-methyltransferase YrrM
MGSVGMSAWARRGGSRRSGRSGRSRSHEPDARGKPTLPTTETRASPGDTPGEQPVKNFGMSEELFEYIVDHIREPETLKELRQTTKKRFPRAPTMAVGPDQGAFLGWLVETLQVKNAIEVGVFTGYSSICIGRSLQKNGGNLLALDKDPKAMDVAREYWERLGLVQDGTIKAMCGDAMESLEAVRERDGADSFDFAFVDANKRGYKAYYEILLELVRPGGVIALDNVLWYGKVSDGSVNDETTKSIRELNEFIRQDERVSMSLVPVGDGITLCTVR